MSLGSVVATVATEVAEKEVPRLLVKEAVVAAEKPVADAVLHGAETTLGDAVTQGLLSKGGAAPVQHLGYVANTLGQSPVQRIFADVQGTVLKVKGPFPGHNGLMHEIMRIRVEGNPALAVQGSVAPGAALLPQVGQEIEVANDVTVGAMVPKSVLGQQIAVRGVVYQDGSKMGIHWTHDAKHGQPGGFIKTLIDGHIFK